MRTQLSEKWLPIPGYEAFYEISTSGRVYSLARAGTAGGYVYPWPNPAGRLRVRLSKYGHTRSHSVGVLVLLAHSRIPRPSPFAHPHYRDGDVTHNSLSNLFWTSWSGTLPSVKHGEAVNTAKMTAAIVADCRRRYAAQEAEQQDLCAQYGVNSATMSQAIHGITWKSVTDPPPIPREHDGRAVYRKTERGREQSRKQAGTTNRIRYGPAA